VPGIIVAVPVGCGANVGNCVAVDDAGRWVTVGTPGSTVGTGAGWDVQDGSSSPSKIIQRRKRFIKFLTPDPQS
jgi:hypothetical protein